MGRKRYTNITSYSARIYGQRGGKVKETLLNLEKEGEIDENNG